MSLENLALAKTDDFPIEHEGDVHDGKVRGVYWLTPRNSARLGERFGANAPADAPLGIMIISDRISAFEVIWHGQDGLQGVPGKGAALNAISEYWFGQLDRLNLAGNHLVHAPHPLVWVVQRAKPVMVEAVARQYITGSMWRDYNEKGARLFCGIPLPDGLKKDQRLDTLLLTPTTKGTLRGISGVPEQDDVNLTREQILQNFEAFGFDSPEDVDFYEALLSCGFRVISDGLKDVGQIFVDTKLEFGYAPDRKGQRRMIIIDEIGTPDSSRMWSAADYAQGRVVENSKEDFRQFLLGVHGGKPEDILLNKKRMPERIELAAGYEVPNEVMMRVSAIYKKMAETITGYKLREMEDPRGEVMEALSELGVLETA